ncbi:MAG: 5'-nucleotidase C-terminal domain-containing protein [Clostridia bacterium]|nr:5'-nucleotidase C-terminal domain-containing protein [Clostridia bacterium]
MTITAINGEPYDPAATYAVVTNNFIAAGGDTYNVFNRAYEAGTGFDTGIPLDQALVEYITEALGGVITAEQYANPRGSLTILMPEVTEEEAEEPAA